MVILDDPWDYAWYNRYNHYYYHSPWYWGAFGFSSFYWSRYYGGWYDPWFYDPWYGGYYGGWYSGLYDPWYYGPYDPWYYGSWYGYGHRYGWYDHPYYPGGYWGGGYRYGRDLVYTPRNTTTVGGSRERRPGSGANYRYGTPGSSGSVIRGGSNALKEKNSLNCTRARGSLPFLSGIITIGS